MRARDLLRKRRARCFYCQKRPKIRDATVEHLGPHRLVLACKRCNGAVGSLSLYHKLCVAAHMAEAGVDPVEAANRWVKKKALEPERDGRRGNARVSHEHVDEVEMERLRMIELWGPPRSEVD